MDADAAPIHERFDLSPRDDDTDFRSVSIPGAADNFDRIINCCLTAELPTCVGNTIGSDFGPNYMLDNCCHTDGLSNIVGTALKLEHYTLNIVGDKFDATHISCSVTFPARKETAKQSCPTATNDLQTQRLRQDRNARGDQKILMHRKQELADRIYIFYLYFSF